MASNKKSQEESRTNPNSDSVLDADRIKTLFDRLEAVIEQLDKEDDKRPEQPLEKLFSDLKIDARLKDDKKEIPLQLPKIDDLLALWKEHRNKPQTPKSEITINVHIHIHSAK